MYMNMNMNMNTTMTQRRDNDNETLQKSLVEATSSISSVIKINEDILLKPTNHNILSNVCLRIKSASINGNGETTGVLNDYDGLEFATCNPNDLNQVFLLKQTATNMSGKIKAFRNDYSFCIDTENSTNGDDSSNNGNELGNEYVCEDTASSFDVTKPDGTVIPQRNCDWVAQHSFRCDFAGSFGNCPGTCNPSCFERGLVDDAIIINEDVVFIHSSCTDTWQITSNFTFQSEQSEKCIGSSSTNSNDVVLVACDSDLAMEWKSVGLNTPAPTASASPTFSPAPSMTCIDNSEFNLMNLFTCADFDDNICEIYGNTPDLVTKMIANNECCTCKQRVASTLVPTLITDQPTVTPISTLVPSLVIDQPTTVIPINTIPAIEVPLTSSNSTKVIGISVGGAAIVAIIISSFIYFISCRGRRKQRKTRDHYSELSPHSFPISYNHIQDQNHPAFMLKVPDGCHIQQYPAYDYLVSMNRPPPSFIGSSAADDVSTITDQFSRAGRFSC
mmetsp:Transcript_24402/g.27898  ORF Transcript_24402/g.27898 Transcript_24402/m.27898 type:complete len:503 (-) Transcript_24402:158-1666(-)